MRQVSKRYPHDLPARNQIQNLLPRMLLASNAIMDFVGELKKIIKETPRMCVASRNVENCPYGDFIYNCKNCYLCFDTGGSQDCYYVANSMKNKECVDCDLARWSELCYECLNIERCYNCDWCIDCNNCHDLTRCFDCIGCNDCYGSIGLRRKSHYFYNKQLTKDEYKKSIKNKQRLFYKYLLTSCLQDDLPPV